MQKGCGIRYYLQPQPFTFNSVQGPLQFSAVAVGALNDTYAVDTSPCRGGEGLENRRLPNRA